MVTARRAGAVNALVRIVGLHFALATMVALFHSSTMAVEPDLRSQVRAGIRQLTSPSRAARARAEQTLLKLGPEILPLLPPPDLLESASVRVAVRRIRIRLEHDAAEDSIRPSTVSLTGTFSIEEFIRKIEHQTGNTVSPSGLSKERRLGQIVVQLQNAPFWSAIGELERVGVAATFDQETGLLTLHPGTSKDLMSVSTLDRSFRIVASPLQWRGDSDQSDTLLNTQLRILCEPRLRPLFLKYRTSNFHLQPTDSGETIEPFNAGANIEVPLGNGGREATVPLSFLSESTLPEASSLDGKATILIAASEQPISFRELSRSRRVARRRGGVTVTINEVNLNNSLPDRHEARVELRVSYDLGAEAFESHQTWVFHNRVYLMDQTGSEYGPNGGFTTLHQGDGSVALEYRFKDLPTDPAEWDFVYVAPTLLINVEIPIALRNIPIIDPKSAKE